MLSLPLPIVIALILTLLLIREREQVFGAGRWLLLLCIWQSLLVGLRFGYGVEAVRVIQPLSAILIPPLAWWGLRGLQQATVGAWRWHAIPPLALIIGMLVSPLAALTDLALIGSYLAYGVLIVRAMSAGADSLRAASLARVRAAVFAWRGLGLVLILSAVLDAGVALAFMLGQAALVPGLLSVNATLILLLVGWMSVAAGWHRESAADLQQSEPPTPTPAAEPESQPREDTNQADQALLSKLDEALSASDCYRDPELNLDQLARLTRIPSRRISSVVNQLLDLNVSQYVNGFRVRDAQRRLQESDLPVTTIMYECGFQTKSNFNREFRRVSGMSPTAWREQATP